jgi:hypothetical protein
MLLKIHLGCGPHKLPGWVNCDKEVDIRRPLPFASASAECMLAEHVLEHVSPAQGWSFLEEAFRVLAPACTLRLIVPSLERVAQFADEEYIQGVARLARLPPTMKNALWCTIGKWGHRSVWTEATLRIVLQAIGFEIQMAVPGVSQIANLNGVDQHHKTVGIHINTVESLIFEATKPAA